MLEGTAATRRLPFTFHAHGGIGRLVLADLAAGPVHIERLELEVSDLGTDPGATSAERFQRRRTRLRALTTRITGTALDQRVEAARRPLAGLGVTQVQARLNDGFISVRARAADGLAAADVSFRVHLVTAGVQLRALASHIRVHGHLPSPGPIVADRIIATLLGATDVAGVVERPHARGLCDVEIDLVGALLWHLMPPAGWRLPAVQDIDLVHVRVSRAAVEIAYGPTGSRTGDLGVRPAPLALAAAHDLMHSADQQLRSGHVEEAMRGYRTLLAAGGPEQPQLLERILSLAAARPAWFFDGLELARQALGRWQHFPAAHAALASIMLAQGDAREAASHLSQLAHHASADGDDDQAALAALAGARLLRVLEPKAATQLYELALEHDPSSSEAADALADRLGDEQRWPELVRLLRARAVTAETDRAVELRLKLADVFVHQLDDSNGAQHELEVARDLAPDNPAVHEMTATILASSNPAAALEAWRQVARLAESRGDMRSAARAFAIVGELLAKRYEASEPELWEEAEAAWRRALELDPLQPEAIAGLATAAAARGAHGAASDLYERLRGLGLPQHMAARYELMLARSLVHLGRIDEARASLRRATAAGGETAAEAHAVLAEIAEASEDREHAAVELDTAIASFVGLAGEGADDRLYARAAELAVARATLLETSGQRQQATADWERAHELAANHAPAIARDAARTMLSRAADPRSERRWVDAVLATRPPAEERAHLLIHRADVRRREENPDVAAAIADLHEALELSEDSDVRRRAYQLEADLLAKSGDQRARAQALTALARLAERSGDRIEVETAAAAAWLAADEPATALPHGARAHAELVPNVAPTLRREVLTTLGEAAWRQRAWPDVIRAYRGLVDDEGLDPAKLGIYRYRLAVAGDRSGDPNLALEALRPLVEYLANPASDGADAARATPVDIRGQALRLFADLAERAGDLGGAAAALEGFAGVALESTESVRADAMYRAGELFRRAERRDDAVRCLEAALRISDTHLPALDALELAWRERGDIDRVAVILGRKVAVTSRHPQRQKPLLSRLGDLQEQLGRPDVALATHQRALEIDSAWRPSLRYVTQRLAADGQLVAAAGGYAQLAGELPSDNGIDVAVVTRDRQLAAEALSELVAKLDDAQVEAVRSVADPALQRAASDPSIDIKGGLARLRGESGLRSTSFSAEENTPSGRVKDAPNGALSLREGAKRARAAGKLQDALASLEAANHVSPNDQDVLREIVDIATELGDHESAAKHLALLADLQTGSRKGETLLGLADIYYDRIEDVAAARGAMRDAAEAFGFGARRDSTLRLLASEAASHLAWNIAVDGITGIDPQRRTAADVVLLANALARSGRPAEAIGLVEDATATGKLTDGGELLGSLRAELARKAQVAARLEDRATSASGDEADAMRTEANALWQEVGEVAGVPLPNPGFAPTVPNTPAASLAQAADRDKLLQAHRDNPDDAAVLTALLAHLGDREPSLRREILERVGQDSHGRAQAVALHELALAARMEQDPIRAAALWTKAHRVDPSYAPVWMPLADALAGADEIDLAQELYEQIAVSTDYDEHSRRWARERADALGHDDAVVSGEIKSKAEPSKPTTIDLDVARDLAEHANWQDAIKIAEGAADANPANTEALELLEMLYFEVGDITAASEAIGRQLMLFDDPDARARLWRKRAKLYRDALGRDAEAYRCLKEAHACAPADAEIAYQLRTAAMVRGEWALVASLLYREIAASPTARERGALHLELALIFEEKLGDPAQAQVNYEQALSFDPMIPAAKAPLARRYEELGRHADAAKLFNEAATTARPADRIVMYQGATRNRALATSSPAHSQLTISLEKAESDGDREAALDLATELWKAEPGHPAAFRVLVAEHRNTGDLAALTELATVRANKATETEDRARAWLDVARLAEDVGKLAEAARAYDLALIEEPRNPAALDARGALAFKLSDWPTADLIYRDLVPDESVLGADDLAMRRSVIAEQLGRHEEALTLAKHAAQTAPGRSDVMLRVQHLATATGELKTAIGAARAVLDLIPISDDDTTLRTRHALVELYRMVGEFDHAIQQLEVIVRDHPHHGPSIEMLAELHIAKNDWRTATRYLFQLVPLARTPQDRAQRLYRLGEAVLTHLGDVDRADDVFLRACDLDPTHVPTLRRLLDVYWRADDPGALVEVAAELVHTGGLTAGPITGAALGRALVAAALIGETDVAKRIAEVLGEEAPPRIAAALADLKGRAGRIELAGASTAIHELARRGVVDMQKLRQAASGTAAEQALAGF